MIFVKIFGKRELNFGGIKMKIKSLLCAALCAVLLLSAAACAKPTLDDPSSGTPTPTPPAVATPGEDAPPPASPPADESAPGDIDFDAAFAAYPPDTLMLTVGGIEFGWSKLYSFLFAAIADVANTTGALPDWSLPEDDGLSYKDYIITSTLDNISTYAAIEYGAKTLGVALSDEDRAEIAFERESTVSQFGGEGEFAAALKEYGMTEETYAYRVSIEFIAQRTIEALYGENYEKITDEEAAKYIESEDFLMAKHILILTGNEDEEGNRVPMSDAEKAVAKERADAIYAQLKAYKGDDFESYFDTLMNENSQDAGGLALNPGGYLFQAEDMVPQFEAGTRALGIGEFGEPVESDFGYHIILRLPIDYDATPMRYSGYEGYTIRSFVASDDYDTKLQFWKTEMTATYTPEYDAFDITKVFANK
jgi:hypothetical protein